MPCECHHTASNTAQIGPKVGFASSGPDIHRPPWNPPPTLGLRDPLRRRPFLFAHTVFEGKCGRPPAGHAQVNATTRGVRTRDPLRLPSASHPTRSRTPALAPRQLAGARERDASQATTATAPPLSIIPLPNSFPQTTPLRSREGAPRSTPLRESPNHCERARRIWTQTRGDRRRGKRLPPLLPGPTGRCACSCDLLKMASVCCGVCRECGRRS